jgi:hypothetical protein
MMANILLSRHEIMVNNCLICGHFLLSDFGKCRQVFDFSQLEAYKPRFLAPNHPHDR